MSTLKKIILRHLPISALAMVGCLVGPAKGATLTEPPTILFGKVVHVGDGASYQVHAGTLALELERSDDPDHVISLKTQLDRIGTAGQLSYRIEIPVKHVPEPDELAGSLAVGFDAIVYEVRSITIDGSEAVPLDASKSFLSTSFSERAGEHQLDLQINIPQVDSDDDGMPDWWEKLYGLNIHLSSDTTLDSDGDGLDNLAEFRAGTDPTSANTTPLIQTTSLIFPHAGQAGFHLQIVDTDTDPSDLQLTITSIPSGISFHRPDQVIAANDNITYQDILDGLIYIKLDPAFESGALDLVIQELDPSGTPQTETITLSTFSPQSVSGSAPVAWLHSSSPPTPGPLGEWADQSEGQRDGYQPHLEQRPLSTNSPRSSITFSGNEFFFFDDRNLDADDNTVFLAFRPSPHDGPQTLLRSGNLDISIGGSDNADFSQSLKVTAAGRVLRGRLVSPEENSQLTITGHSSKTILASARTPTLREKDNHGLGPVGSFNYVSSLDDASDGLIPPSFSTIGAAHEISKAESSSYFQGEIHEIILYDHALGAAARTRNEDYQGSRWGDLRVWDFRGQVVPLSLTGSPTSPNSLHGGWSHDHLTGGNLGDTLQGGSGNDILTGGAGPDRFLVFKSNDNDQITDFDPSTGDVLDLSGIFASAQGNPADFIRIRLEFVRINGEVPRVNSVIELDHNGSEGGWSSDQSITIENANFGNTQLPQLVGENSIILGGLSYPATLSLLTESSEIFENEQPHSITLTRTGNLDAALEISLSFTGNATLADDYELSMPGTGTVRSLGFERGQSEIVFQIIPKVDSQIETEQLVITIMAQAGVTTELNSSLELPFIDVPHFAIHTRKNATLGQNGSPGSLVITRSNLNLDQATEINLNFNGSRINGIGFSLLANRVTFPANVSEVELMVVPTGPQVAGPDIDHIEAGLTKGSDSKAYLKPHPATLFFLPSGVTESPPFGDWLNANFPNNNNPDLPNLDPDGDHSVNIFEFIHGTSPTIFEPAADSGLQFKIVKDRAEIEIVTTIGWSDVDLIIESSADLNIWTDATAGFKASFSLFNDKLRRNYRSKAPINGKLNYRLRAIHTPDTL